VLNADREHLTDRQHFVDGMNRLGHVRSGGSNDVLVYRPSIASGNTQKNIPAAIHGIARRASVRLYTHA
jgi:hypothetical protein